MEAMDEIEILLVEDNPNDAELTLRALKKSHLANKIVTLKDGVQALDFLFANGEYAFRKDQNVPRVIFLDLKLPRLNGLEVLQKIKNDEKTRQIPVVVLTSSREDRDIEKCYELGVNSYIVKPVDFKNFMEAITNLGLYWMVLNKAPNQ